MFSRTRFPVLALLAAVVALPATALADSFGSSGELTRIVIYDSSSDDYSQKRGEVDIRTSGGSSTTYVWGGSKCNNMNLSSTNIRLLADVVNNADKTVTPRWKSGMGSTRCIVGFTVSVPPAAVAR